MHFFWGNGKSRVIALPLSKMSSSRLSHAGLLNVVYPWKRWINNRWTQWDEHSRDSNTITKEREPKYLRATATSWGKWFAKPLRWSWSSLSCASAEVLMKQRPAMSSCGEHEEHSNSTFPQQYDYDSNGSMRFSARGCRALLRRFLCSLQFVDPLSTLRNIWSCM